MGPTSRRRRPKPGSTRWDGGSTSPASVSWTSRSIRRAERAKGREMIRSDLVVTKKTPLAPRGLVVAEHPMGADVGAAMLARGGNAIDAAVATAFAMTVVEPFMSTIAGAGTMLVHLASENETLTVDFNAIAPAAAYDGMYRIVGGGASELFAWPRVADDANVIG